MLSSWYVIKDIMLLKSLKTLYNEWQKKQGYAKRYGRQGLSHGLVFCMED